MLSKPYLVMLSPQVRINQQYPEGRGIRAGDLVNQETHGLFEVHSAVVQAIKEAAEREGIDLLYPVQTVRLKGGWPGET